MNIVVPGQRVPYSGDTDSKLGKFLPVQVLARFEIRPPERGIGGEIAEHEDVEPGDVLEIELKDGLTLWMSAGRFRDLIRETDPALIRDDLLRFPASAPPGQRTRGGADLLFEGLKILRIDPARSLANLAVANRIASIEEKLQLELETGGLHAVAEDGALRQAGDLTWCDAPYLVLIHGTASTTKGSFGRLFGTPEWHDLFRKYDGRVLAFEHRTLSQDPAQNALELATALPEQAELHLLTHSRGGLVGELLCFDRLTERDLEAFDHRDSQKKTLRDLSRVLRSKTFKVNRFVRVACPARGTILASDRLDLYLSILLNVIGQIPGLGDAVLYSFLKAVVLEIASSRADPGRVPGLEAQMPNSPFIHLLNRPGATVAADLAVIAGDIQGAGIWGRLKVLAADLFFRGDNDLVVDTEAMYGGRPREKDAYFSFHRGTDVSHFNYFAREVTRREIRDWLVREGDDPPAAFTRLKPHERVEFRTPLARSESNRVSKVVIVPGLMAARLKDAQGRIWLDMEALSGGGLRRLAEPGVAVENLDSAYQKLADHLSRRYEVLQPFLFDWRRSARDAAAKLAVRLEGELLQHSGPIHVVAHSTGALVALNLIIHEPETWTRLRRRDSRLVLLGCPTRGSHAILRLLAGQGRLARMLHMLDGSGDVSNVLNVLSGFPGLLELLPDQKDCDVHGIEWWRKIKRAAEPSDAALEQARRNRDALNRARIPAEGLYAVFGVGQLTPSRVYMDEGDDQDSDRRELAFQGTERGDGVVTCESGAVEGVPIWYAECAHGDLIDDDSVLSTTVDLLHEGDTNILQQSVGDRFSDEVPIPAQEPVLFPTEDELAAVALGRKAPASTWEEQERTRVSVAHGSLESARYPVVAGHYEGDSLVGPEADLDRRLDRRLSERHLLGVYPGPIGTVEVILDEQAKPKGAIIAGLGKPGDLTPQALARGVREALLRYAVELVDRAEASDTEPVAAGFSPLLIGAGTLRSSSLTVENSVAAIVRATLSANRALREQGPRPRVRFTEIQFIELYEDRAIEAAHVVGELRSHVGLDERELESLEPAPRLESLRDGLPPEAAFERKDVWWRRLQIAADNDAPGPRDNREQVLSLDEKKLMAAKRGEIRLEDLLKQEAIRVRPEEVPGTGLRRLKFTLLTDRARAPETRQPIQKKLLDSLVEEAANWQLQRHDENAGLLLFNLLLPESVKEILRGGEDLVLIVDSHASRYPWEILADQTLEGPQPIANRLGMIRQFLTPQAPRIRSARGDNALVIGDPVSPSVELKAAQEEARAIHGLLESAGYVSTSLIRENHRNILEKLVSAEYRIMHISGHGVFRPDQPGRSGVVIGDGLYLTAQEVSQLPVVPDLVFLNCCHIGRMSQRPDLAASIAEQLINVGVRAVVAAGWPVEDYVARCFAESFYSSMLEGDQFGDAVRTARRRAFEYSEDRQVNTWCAYQCYGDPGFRLTRIRRAESSRRSFVSPKELINRIRHIAAEAGHIRAQDVERLVSDLDAELRKTPPEWLTGELEYELGWAYSELRESGKAVRHYRNALKSWESDWPIRMLEQLANQEIRLAVEIKKRSPGTTPYSGEFDPDELIDEALKRLDAVLKVGRTPERLSLLGSAYKRLATGLENGRDEALENASNYYREANELHLKEKHRVDYYPALNYVSLQYILDRVDADGLQALDDLITRSESAARDEDHIRPSFWTRVTVADAERIRLLLKDRLSQEQKKVIDLYTRIFRERGSAREHDSAVKDIELQAELFRRRPEQKETREALLRIAESLRQK